MDYVSQASFQLASQHDFQEKKRNQRFSESGFYNND